jgi:hypothetical protein
MEIAIQYALATLMLFAIMSISAACVWAFMLFSKSIVPRCIGGRFHASHGIAMLEADEDWTRTTTAPLCKRCLAKRSGVIEFWTWEQWHSFD